VRRSQVGRLLVLSTLSPKPKPMRRVRKKR
jgi:hypothetical protein